MGAPSTAYLNGGSKLSIHAIGVTKLDSVLALKLAEYGSSIRELFYVHHLLLVKKDDGIGFLGAVEANTSEAYYQMHSTARHSKMRLKNPSNGKVYIVLNDAGLNTLGLVGSYIVVSTVCYNVILQANFKAAYYLGSTEYGFRTRLRNVANSGWESWTNYNLQPTSGAIQQKSEQTINSPGIVGDGNRLMQVQAFMVNGEGTFYGENQDIYPTAQPITFYNNGTTFYINGSSIEVGTKLYANENFTGYFQGSNGNGNYWVDSRYYWRYGYDVISDSWVFLELVDSQPPTPYTPSYFEYSGYSDYSQQVANDQVIYGAHQYGGRLYLNADTAPNIWYSGWNATNGFYGIPADGYYAQGDVSGVNGELYLINGYQQ